jgi:PAS domain S-box-containing protein
MDAMNVDILTQQMMAMQGRLAELYQSANASETTQLDLLPLAFKELGVASERLMGAVEELHQQNEELANIRQNLEVERQCYQDLFESAPDGYLVTDLGGVVTEANRTATKLLNILHKFLVGKPLALFVVEDKRYLFRRQLIESHQRDRMPEWSTRLQPRHGEPFDAALSVTVVRDWKGQPTALRWLVRDISDRKRAEALLCESPGDFGQDRPVHLCAKGEILPLQPQELWLVRKGLVKLTTLSEKGEEILVGLVGSSMPFGSNLTALPTYQATALTDTQLVCIPLTELATSPQIAQILLAKISQRLRQTEHLLAISGRRRVSDRLHQLLLLLKQEIGQPVPEGTCLNARLTHEDLANACCTTRVTITRLLSKLQQQGKIQFDHRHYMVLSDEFK